MNVQPGGSKTLGGFAVVLLLVGGLVFLPALRSPLFLDDFFQTAMIEGTYPSPRNPFDLYNLVSDADRAILLDRGLLPWWTHPRLSVRFLRPLSSALRYADHRVLDNRPLPSHLHSFVWWVAAVLAARALYRRVLGSRAALFATFMFALAPCHAFPLAWLANRVVLVSVTFGLLGLSALLRFYDHGRRVYLTSAAAAFTLSLLGGEYALTLGGYAVALALAVPRATRRRRVLGLLSFAAPAVAYLLARASLGYGTAGSGFYHDPSSALWTFLRHAPRRWVALFAEGWFHFSVDTLTLSTPAWVFAAVAVVGVVLLCSPLRHAWASLDDERRWHAAWLLGGSVLSFAPVLAAMPWPRMLAAPALGIAATVALSLESAWSRHGSLSARLLALGLGLAHLAYAPVASWRTSRGCERDARLITERAALLRERLAAPERAEVVVVRGQSAVLVLPYALDARGAPPWRWRLLADTPHVLVRRLDARTLDLSAGRDRGLFPSGEGYLYRGEGSSMAPGDVVQVPGMRATVMEVGEAGPRRVRFELDEPLESPARVWVAERSDGLCDATPPPVGFGVPFGP